MTIYFDADPDPTFTLMRIRFQTRIWILPFTLMCILILILPQIWTLICSKMIQHNPLTLLPYLFYADFFNDPKKQEGSESGLICDELASKIRNIFQIYEYGEKKKPTTICYALGFLKTGWI
jgi:hypothetical protein